MGAAKRKTDIIAKASVAAAAKTLPNEDLQGPDGLLLLIEFMNHAFVNLPMLFEEANKRVNEKDLEYSDLTHAVELADFPRRDAHGILLKLKENRTQRRGYKDFITMAEPLIAYTKRHPIMTSDITTIRTSMLKLKGTLESRKYKLKTMESMEEAFNKAGMKTAFGVLTTAELAAISGDDPEEVVVTSEVGPPEE